MPPLPSIRLSPVIPFLNIGIDLFGPLYVFVHQHKGEAIKVYAVIFVCLVTRAIHIEVACNLTAGEFLLAFLRYEAIRGKPHCVISDNATNFTFIQLMLGNKVEITDLAVQKHFFTTKIDWYFIPAYSPWYGGAYEKMNDLVRNV